jgi:DNA helicase IV
VKKWLDNGRSAHEIAVLIPTNKLAETIAERLVKAGIANHCMVGRENKAAYNPGEPLVTVLSIYSSKGLEFDTVVLAGIDRIQYIAEE